MDEQQQGTVEDLFFIEEVDAPDDGMVMVHRC